MRISIAAEHYQQVADHGGFFLLVQFDDVFAGELFQGPILDMLSRESQHRTVDVGKIVFDILIEEFGQKPDVVPTIDG